METLDQHILIRFSKKTGKIDTVLEALGKAQLEMWALTHTPKTKGCAIFIKSTGHIVYSTTGTEDGFPEVNDCAGGNIEEICPGLLQAVQ